MLCASSGTPQVFRTGSSMKAYQPRPPGRRLRATPRIVSAGARPVARTARVRNCLRAQLVIVRIKSVVGPPSTHQDSDR